jgi:hypothetical protein
MNWEYSTIFLLILLRQAESGRVFWFSHLFIKAGCKRKAQ